ncbi:MAG: hypothetical protein IPP32_13690 [Bacteroidetes bacterium]|nr:hypothetical protein [Bacteroidota bacterium]
MKKILLVLILPLAVVSGIVFANREEKTETKPSSKPSPKPLSAADRKARLDAKKKWEATPDGIHYKAWEGSPAGKKVHASYDRIKHYINAFSDMEAVVSSVTFQRPNANATGPKWLIVKIMGEEYMMQFIPKDFEKLKSLKVNDRIIVRSRSAGYSPNHPYLIISSDYIAQNNTILFKRDLSKNNGC